MNQEKVWDNISEKWNEFRFRMSPTVEEFVSKQQGIILDVGCGSGRNFMKVEGLGWAAVDFSGEMVRLAKEKAEEIGVDAKIVKASSDKLPFEDSSFDSVLCFAVIHCVDSVEKRKKTIEEIFRVLKVDGEALIASWGSKGPRLKNKPRESFIPWTVKEGGEKQLRYNYIFELDELVELVESVGFEVVRSWEEKNVNVIVRKPKS